jgi:hypothetical protein
LVHMVDLVGQNPRRPCKACAKAERRAEVLDAGTEPEPAHTGREQSRALPRVQRSAERERAIVEERRFRAVPCGWHEQPRVQLEPSGRLIEPWVVGKKTGVSALALLISALLVNARFYCRRLRALFPDVPLFVYSPDVDGKRLKEADARLRAAGANHVVGSVREATRALLSPDTFDPAPSSSALAELRAT